MATVKNQNGKEVDFEIAVFYMDDDLREQVHAELAPCGEQEFFDRYTELHQQKFGEDYLGY